MHECCCYDVHVCCVDSMAVSTVCIYVHVSVYVFVFVYVDVQVHVHVPCACALCLCMCIICASIHIVKNCFFVCQVSPVLSWMGLFFNSRGLFPSPSNWANSEVVWSMCPTYPGQALWNTRFPAGVLPSPARYSFWVHIRKRPQRLEVGCGDRAWT